MSHMDYVIAEDSKGKIKIGMGTGTIGPAHDPYGTETLEVIRGDRTVEWYFNGLGMERVRFYEKKEGRDVLIREINWNAPFLYGNAPKLEDMTERDRRTTLESRKAELLFKNFVGIRREDATNLFHIGYEPDPMGHPSMYE